VKEQTPTKYPAWLVKVEVSDAVKDKLIAEGFESLVAIAHLTNDDLKELDIKLGHRKVLLALAESVRKQAQSSG